MAKIKLVIEPGEITWEEDGDVLTIYGAITCFVKQEKGGHAKIGFSDTLNGFGYYIFGLGYGADEGAQMVAELHRSGELWRELYASDDNPDGIKIKKLSEAEQEKVFSFQGDNGMKYDRTGSIIVGGQERIVI